MIVIWLLWTIMLKWRWIRLTDCTDYSIIAFFSILACILSFFFVCSNCSCHSVRTSCWNKRLLTYLLTYLLSSIFSNTLLSVLTAWQCLADRYWRGPRPRDTAPTRSYTRPHRWPDGKYWSQTAGMGQGWCQVLIVKSPASRQWLGHTEHSSSSPAPTVCHQ